MSLLVRGCLLDKLVQVNKPLAYLTANLQKPLL